MGTLSNPAGERRAPRRKRRAAPPGSAVFTPFLVTVLMVTAAGVMWLLLNPSAREARDLAGRVQALNDEVAALEHRQAELRAWRDGLRTDPLVIEREARRQLGRVRPGEVAVMYERPRRRAAPTRPAANATPGGTRLAIYIVLGLLALTVPALWLTCREER